MTNGTQSGVIPSGFKSMGMSINTVAVPSDQSEIRKQVQAAMAPEPTQNNMATAKGQA